MIERFIEFTSVISVIYKSVQKIERTEMEKYGLKGPNVQCLIAIGQNKELTSAKLSEICEKDKASISRSLSTLEAKKLILRESGYRGKISLTEEGRKVAKEIEEKANKCVKAASLNFNEEERKKFYNNLETIGKNLIDLT